MESTTTLVPLNLEKTYVRSKPDEYFAYRVHMYEHGKYKPLRSYKSFTTTMNHFNKYIRKHLTKQWPLFNGTKTITCIRFIYDYPSGILSKHQRRYIQQWGENGINDLLDREFGCTITPHMLVSMDNKLVMLYIMVDWQGMVC